MLIANKFNEVVCISQKEHKHNKIGIFHLIDVALKYSAACLASTKDKNEIVKQILRIRSLYFRFPKQFFSDDGGEFSNEVFCEMNEKPNAEMRTTARKSLFSNGIVQRHNKFLFEAFSKTFFFLNKYFV